MTVAEWSAFNRSEIKTKLRAMNDLTFVDMMKEEPSRSSEIVDFHIHLGQMVTFFQNSIESSTFTLAPPKTTQPPQTSRPWKASTSDGSGSNDATPSVTTRPSYSIPTFAPPPSVNVPTFVSPPGGISVGLDTWQIVLIIVVSIILILRLLHWFIKRQAKQKKLREEAAAEAAELGQSDFVVVNPRTVEEKQIKVVQ